MPVAVNTVIQDGKPNIFQISFGISILMHQQTGDGQTGPGSEKWESGPTSCAV